MSESMSVTKDSSAGSTKLLWVVPLAVAVAALANVLFYYIVIEIFRFPMMFLSETNTAELVRMPVYEVVLFSGILGTGVDFALRCL